MKTCPVCKTQVFDDMDTCFGCMFRFNVLDAEGAMATLPSVQPAAQVPKAPQPAVALSSATALPTVLTVPVVPSAANERLAANAAIFGPEDWTIRIELRSACDPDRVCRFDLVAPFAAAAS